MITSLTLESLGNNTLGRALKEAANRLIETISIEDEIEIVESGIRPGEKLYEELLADDENTAEQIFEKIFVGKVHNLPLHRVNAFIHSLDHLNNEELRETLVTFANNTYEENQEVTEELILNDHEMKYS